MARRKHHGFMPAPSVVQPVERSEYEPTFTLDHYIAEGKRDAARWAELNKEWEA